MSIPNRSLAKLRERLPRGYASTAVTRLRAMGEPFSEDDVYNVASGRRFIPSVIEVLLDLADEHQRRIRNYARRAEGKAATS